MQVYLDSLRLMILSGMIWLCSFNASAQIMDTTKYLEVEVLIPIWSGDTIVSASYVQEELDQLNNSFQVNNTGIQFVLCGGINYINDLTGQLATGFSGAPYGQYEKRGAIHIWHCTVLPGGVPALTNSDGRILIAGHYGMTSIEHEMGHVLALRHTHQSGELVNGSNCTTAGDLVCDTPADPGLNGSNVNGACNYTGLATDANGDPYTPLTNNFMSYAPNACRNSFTQGQTDRMNNYLNTAGFWLNRIDSVRDVLPIPTNYCSTDPGGYALTTLLGESTVSGPGVVGNMFYPSIAGPGIHEILIDHPTDSVLYNDFVATSQGSSPSTLDAWNSYPVANGGVLQYVYCLVQVASTTNLTLEVRNGSGIGGALLHSQVVTINPTAGFEWIQIPISSLVNLNTGQICTFRFISGAAISYAANLYIYPGVNSNLGLAPPPYKNLYCMVVQLKGPESCGNVGYRYVEVHETDNGSIVDLRSDYCNTLSHEIALTGIPSDGLFFIDGLPETTLSPQNHSLGSHVLEFISTDMNGCAGLITHYFTIDDQTVSIVPVPAASYFMGDAPVNLTGIPAGGTMLIDGNSTNVLDPTSLGIGTHQVTYFNYEIQDSVDFDGPENPNPGWTFYKIFNQDSIAWQEFMPTESGYLSNIGILGLIPSEITVEAKLFKGSVDLGNVLWSDTILANVNLDGYKLIFDTLNSVYLDQDSLYAFSVKRLDNIGTMWLPYSSSDIYMDGMSSADTSLTPAFDFSFKAFMFHLAACTDTVTYTFDVTINDAGVETPTANNLVLIYPNPASISVTLCTQEELISVTLMDLMGRIIKTEGCEHKTLCEIFVGNLAPGNYIISMEYSGGRYLESIIIQH